MHVHKLWCIRVLFCVCSCSHRDFAKLRINLCAVGSFPSSNLVGNLQSVGLSDEVRYTGSYVLPAASLSLGEPSHRVSKAWSLWWNALWLHWFIPFNEEKEIDPWILPTWCLSRLKVKSRLAIPSSASQGSMGRQTEPVRCHWEPLHLLGTTWVGLCKTVKQNDTPFPKILYYTCCSVYLRGRRAKCQWLRGHARAEAGSTEVIQRQN